MKIAFNILRRNYMTTRLLHHFFFAFLLAGPLSLVGCGAEVATDELDAESADNADEQMGTTADAETFSYCKANWADAPADYWTQQHTVAHYLSSVPDTWGDKSNSQSVCLSKLICKESTWHVHSENGIYKGMYQLGSGKFPIVECTFSKYWNGGNDKNGVSRPIRFWQHYAGLKYIIGRYGTPCAAWSHMLSYNWY
jgi:hypothetical protein